MSLTSALAVTASVARTSAELSTSTRCRSRAHLVQVAPDLAALRAAPGIHDAHHFPIPAAERDLLPERASGYRSPRWLAHHHFALALRSNQRPLASVHVAAHLDAGGRQAAHRDVGAFPAIGAGEIDHRHDFERGQRLPVVADWRCPA